MDVMEILKAYVEEIDVVIDDSLSKLEPESLYESSEYLIKAGGKKFRPALTLRKSSKSSSSHRINTYI